MGLPGGEADLHRVGRFAAAPDHLDQRLAPRRFLVGNRRHRVARPANRDQLGPLRKRDPETVERRPVPPHGERCLGGDVASVDFGQQHPGGLEHRRRLARVGARRAPDELEILETGGLGLGRSVASHGEHRRIGRAGRRG